MVRGQGQVLANSSSRILEDKDLKCEYKDKALSSTDNGKDKDLQIGPRGQGQGLEVRGQGQGLSSKDNDKDKDLQIGRRGQGQGLSSKTTTLGNVRLS